MQKFKKNKQQKILDVGCGLGGTADYIQAHGWGNVTGFDIEKDSIEYAIQTYPDVEFYTQDVIAVDTIFLQEEFDIICLFNSFYAFPDQKTALLTLNKIARKSATIAIFDYAAKTDAYNISNPHGQHTKNFSFNPIQLDIINDLLLLTAWGQAEIIDITDKYITWYSLLIKKLENNKENIANKFGEENYNKTYNTYTNIYNDLVHQSLQGTIIYAQRN